MSTQAVKPAFSWEPVEFLEVLGTIPEIGEFGEFYHYVLERPTLRLVLSVYPYSAEIALSLYLSGQTEPVIHLRLLDCPAARVISDKRGRWIEFAAAKLLSGRYDRDTAAPYGFRLWLEPYIQIEPYAYPV